MIEKVSTNIYELVKLQVRRQKIFNILKFPNGNFHKFTGRISEIVVDTVQNIKYSYKKKL